MNAESRRRWPRWALFAALVAGLIAMSGAWPLLAQQPVGALLGDGTDSASQVEEFLRALVRLPLATVLACGLALRPRRPGTPRRQPSVIHTQIILAVIGALVMQVVGSSLARAFGIVGAAGLVRYRAKVEDNKDAGVMLSTLAIGLAAGVGQWLLAIFGTVFILVLLWIVESFEPTATRLFMVKIKAKDPAALKGRVESLFRRQKATFEMRTVSPEELLYEIRWPIDRPADRLSERIAAMDASGAIEVELDQKKDK